MDGMAEPKPFKNYSAEMMAAHQTQVREAVERIGHPICGDPIPGGICQMSKQHSGRHA
jgi:hypothetical protein